MRVSYSDEEDYQGQFELWQANCRRSRRGRKGQATLRELEAALHAMPVKELHADVLVEPTGEACAIGAMLLQRKVNEGMTREDAAAELGKLDPENTENHGIELGGMPKLVAWSVAVENDEHHCTIVNDPSSLYGRRAEEEKPATRYERLLAWVRLQLQADGETSP